MIVAPDTQQIKLGGSSRYYIVTEGKSGREMKEGSVAPHASELPSKKPKNETVHCYHLLVKHRGSRNPSSWRSPNITRTKEEAIETLERTRRTQFSD